jgi:hypothetical protein
MAIDSHAPSNDREAPAPVDDITVDGSSFSCSRKSPVTANDRSVKRGRSVDVFVDDLVPAEGPDGVVEIVSSADMLSHMVTDPPAPPPLPPRPVQTKESDLEKQVSNYMAFGRSSSIWRARSSVVNRFLFSVDAGRQNDVTECMDNVMFQIECALNPSANEVDGGEASSVLKRCALSLFLLFSSPPTLNVPHFLAEPSTAK